MDNLDQLSQLADRLLSQMQPAQRRVLARRVATDLRRSQARRIREQRNPNGSPFQPRKNLRRRKGRIRRKAMFAKLRQARYMRTFASPHEAAVHFTRRVERIARVHQAGAVDAVAPGGPRVRYPRRELLGFARGDIQRIRALILEHLTR